jgi:hypothetical protein
MDFFKSHKNLTAIAIIILFCFAFVKCANEANRMGLLPGVQLGNDSPLDASQGPQITTLTDIIDNSEPSQSHIAKQIFIKQTLNRVIDGGLEILELPIEELPWEQAERFFTELGTRPHPAFTQATRVHVYSTESVNGIRYLNAGFNVISNEQGRSSIEETHISFEVEKFEGNFQTTIDFLREGFLGESAEPCLDTLQDHVFFKKDQWIVEIFRETQDSIDLNSVYPPRTLDDVGVVRVSISAGGHYHHLEGTCLPEHSHDHDHDHTLPPAQGEGPR